MNKPLTIIIPSFNNEIYLNPCLMSIINTGILDSMADIIVVNNGKQDIERVFSGNPAIRILNPGKNLGWEGGLELGMKESSSPFVVFQNDDTFLPPTGAGFYQRLLSRFADDNVAAVGPVTTCAGNMQSIYSPHCPRIPKEASLLIFFTVMVRRSHYDAVGGIDTTLPGGDDLDLSIRLRKAGYNLVVDPGAFIIHHGFKTGIRVKGDASVPGGWNSQEMTDRTNKRLIQKHGFKDWWKMMSGLTYEQHNPGAVDLEGNLVRSFVNGDKNIVELGCGPMKTIPKSIGIDRVPRGTVIPHLRSQLSVADIVADVGEPLPLEDESQDVVVARHILEHLPGTIQAIRNWKKVLKIGGKLIVAVPDEKVTHSIPLNPEHCHVFTRESLRDLMEVCGLVEVKSESANNGVSFVGCYERLN
jgi:predicted SAM-dependent methyltransferase